MAKLENTCRCTFKQDAEGLHVSLPERSFEELAYVLKLSFDGKIPPLDKYADLELCSTLLPRPG